MSNPSDVLELFADAICTSDLSRKSPKIQRRLDRISKANGQYFVASLQRPKVIPIFLKYAILNEKTDKT